jgi:uncharacterized membrane protein YhaH (DUF805 family)
MDMSGWWFAAMLIGPAVLGGGGGATSVPALNAIAGILWIGMLVILGAVEGTPGPNRFGPDEATCGTGDHIKAAPASNQGCVASTPCG